MPDIDRNYLTGLSVFAALGVYVWTIFGLRPLVVREEGALSAPQFKEAHPFGKWLIGVHNVLSYLAFLGFMLGGPLLASVFLDESLALRAGAWLAVSGWNLFNGVFELVTGVCPVYGLLIKQHSRQLYLVGRGVRRC